MVTPPQPMSGEGRKLLIVDDDEGVLKALSEYFERFHYTVIRAATGKQGLQAHDAHGPDATILDLRLPDIDGMQILDVLSRKRAMVILLTGYGDIPTAVQAMQLGAENFLTKPVDLPHLVASVERAIEKVDLRRENVRLKKLIPSTRTKITQLIAAGGLAVASWFIGQWVGNLGSEPPVLPEIAPTSQPVTQTPRPRYSDTTLVPGAPRLQEQGAIPRDVSPGQRFQSPGAQPAIPRGNTPRPRFQP